MKMIQAIIRTEKFKEVEQTLEKSGFSSLTTAMVMGRGQQKGLQVGSTHYNILPKQMIWVIVQDDQVEKAIDVISSCAATGSIGDGKIFILDVLDTVRIRTREAGEKAI
ncbi:MAG: P-II family nitrogen regulator [Nitrospirota bacterium]